MKLAELLANKGNLAVTVAATASVADAIHAMNDNHVGSVLIPADAGKPLGIFTERDVMNLCAAGKGGELDTLPISEHMTTEVVVGTPEDTVDGVLNLMTESRFRRLPIMQDGDLVGLVSIGDLVKAKAQEAEQEAQALREYIVS